MAANIRQKVVKLANNAQLVATLNNYLNLGYVVHQVINLAPVSNELLIFYYDPSVDEIPEP
jgi:hypothetical protein